MTTPSVQERLSDHGVISDPATVTTSAATATGDTLIIFCGTNVATAADMNDPTVTGETVVDSGVLADAGTDQPHMKLFTCVLTSGGAKTVDFTASQETDLTLIVYRLTGDCAIDGTPGTGISATNVTSMILAATSPTSADALLLGSVVRVFGGTAEHFAAPASMSNLVEILHGFGGQASAEETLTASGSTGTRTFTNDAGRAFAGILSALTVVGGGGSGVAQLGAAHLGLAAQGAAVKIAHVSGTAYLGLSGSVGAATRTAEVVGHAYLGLTTQHSGTQVRAQSGTCSLGLAAAGQAVKRAATTGLVMLGLIGRHSAVVIPPADVSIEIGPTRRTWEFGDANVRKLVEFGKTRQGWDIDTTRTGWDVGTTRIERNP